MTRKQAIDKVVADDIDDIRQELQGKGEPCYLVDILIQGHIGYQEMTNLELETELLQRFDKEYTVTGKS